MKALILILPLILFFSCGESSLNSDTSTTAGESSAADAGIGTITGAITDGADGNAIDGVTIAVSAQSLSVSSAGNGSFTLNDVTTGTISVTVSKTGYISQTVSVVLSADQTYELNMSLLTTVFSTDKIAIVLSWSDTPADLDSYLYVPLTGSSTSEINYGSTGNISASPFSQLDTDDTNGNGPETMTINYSGSSLNFPRTYRYFVHNYTHDSGANDYFSISNATVRVYFNGTLTNTFNVSNSNQNLYWHVFDIQSDGTVVPVNAYSDTKPATLY